MPRSSTASSTRRWRSSTRPPGPVLSDLEGEEDPDAAPAPVQSGAVDRAPDGDVANEVTAMRRYHERWVQREGRTTVGVTGIPAVRFRGIVRFLQAYAAGGDADHPQRPATCPSRCSPGGARTTSRRCTSRRAS